MEVSIYAIIIFSILSIVIIVSAAILFPGMRDLIKEFKRDL
ncbi:MAG: hypothetical protein V1720_06775 [bacterium]